MLIPISSLLIAISLCIDIDYNTYSNYQDIRLQTLHIEWLLDLDNQYINATAQYQFKVLQDVNHIDLDIYKIAIHFVYYPNGKVIRHEIKDQGDQSALQGDQLVIPLERIYKKGELVDMVIKYSIDSKARALGFLRTEQTDSKNAPYLFSQCEDNNCRSIIPLQDTPSVKQLFSATVLTKDPKVNVFMTGKKITNNKPLLQQYDDITKLTIHKFELSIPIPAYLIGIVAGDLVEQSTGGNTYVISDPVNIQAYATELEDLPIFMDKMEAYIGPYIWGDYKIVILPAAFPFGGMEHPLLTFASPTIIVGDKSGVKTAVHEIAHSWVGNTVTCNNWSNMWINEGFCVFLERKILTQLKGIDSVKIDAIIGESSMLASMKKFGMDHSFSSLHPYTKNKNPDDSTSRVPYEKGYQLLLYLESLIGEVEFQAMLNSYISHFYLQSIDEDDLYYYLLQWVQQHMGQKSLAINAEIRRIYKPWVYNPGLPPIKADFSTPKYTQANTLAADWIAANGAEPVNAAEYSEYQANQVQVFLQYLVDNYDQLNQQILDALDNKYKLTNHPDKKIAYRWYKATLLASYKANIEGVHIFTQTVGVRSYIVSIYETLKSNYVQENYAYDWFEENKGFYHPVVVQALEALLKQTYI